MLASRRPLLLISVALSLLSLGSCCSKRFEFPVAGYRMPGSGEIHGRTSVVVEFPKPCPDESLARPARELSARMSKLFAAMEKGRVERVRFEALADRARELFGSLLLLHVANQKPTSDEVRDGLSELRGVPVPADQARIVLQEIKSSVYHDVGTLVDEMDRALAGR